MILILAIFYSIVNDLLRGTERYLITTPKVLETAQNHFNCDTLVGVELENYNGIGSHWEKRNLNNEYMTATSSDTAVISDFTLSLFEDMGWYQVNRDAAEPLLWGYNKGCEFINSECSDSNPGWDGHGYFCDSISTESCTFDRKAKGRCDVRDYGVSLESYYQVHFTLAFIFSTSWGNHRMAGVHMRIIVQKFKDTVIYIVKIRKPIFNTAGKSVAIQAVVLKEQ